jgi:hypothetical protein
MNIYTSCASNETPPTGFHAIAIRLDGGLKSRLEWKQDLEAARRMAAKKYRLFWCLDLGLFEEADVQSQEDRRLEALKRSVEHFETEVWQQFQEASIGVSLYQGSCSLSEIQVETLEALSAHLPGEAEPFLLLDGSHLSDPIEMARSLSKERFPHFTLAVRGVDLPLQEYGWETSSGEKGFIGTRLVEEPSKNPSVGICLPASGSSPFLYDAINRLKEMGKEFRIIPESLITVEWQGLDYLIVDAGSLSSQTIRKLMGFCAAGGTVVASESAVQFPLAMDPADFFKTPAS